MNLSDKMRINIEMYRSTFKKKQQKYIKELFKEIDRKSKLGKSYIDTDYLHVSEDWFTTEFFKSIPEIFKREGFTVEEKQSTCGFITIWWRISW